MESKSQRSSSDDDDDSMDLETLPRKDFMGVILKKMGSMLDDKLGDVTKQIDGVKQVTTKQSITNSVKEFRAKTTDFDEWKEEMAKQVTRNPSLTIEDAYNLARANNPTKVKETESKYPSGTKSSDEEKVDKKPKFGGQKPSGGSNAEGKRHDMSKDDSAEAAWEETFGKIEDVSSVAQ